MWCTQACVLLEIDMWKLVEGKLGDEMTPSRKS